MAKRYIAVDPGKFATKVAEYIPDKGIRKMSIRTKVSEGDFRDDALEEQTVLIEIDGVTYKVGNGARGSGAALDTDKKSDAHRISTLTGIATLASSNDTDEICVAVGLPAKDWSVVSKRMDFKDYILPAGEVTVKIKKTSTSQIENKTFRVTERFVFPESIGALFADEIITSITPTSITGVLDLGNLNLNATLWQGTELVQDRSSTADLGGAILIQELSQELSANITSCDELITAHILKEPIEKRQLPSGMNLSEEQVAQSRDLIKRVLLEHAEKVRRCCKARNWSLDVTNIVAIGGTSKDIEEELKTVFGNIRVLKNPSYCNAFGYLRMMCARIPEISAVIPLDELAKGLSQDAGKKKSEAT